MSRGLHRLPSKVANLPSGEHADGGELYLYKRNDGSAQWVLRYTLFKRRHEMGLGSFPNVSLIRSKDSDDSSEPGAAAALCHPKVFSEDANQDIFVRERLSPCFS